MFLTGLAGLAACSKPVILKVGWKSGTEQNVLAEIVAQVAGKKLGVPVERLALGGTTEAHQSLVASVIDLYPEYPGAGVAEVLKQDPPTDASALIEMCRAQYQPLQIDWMDPLGFESRISLVMLSSAVKTEQLTTASDLVHRDRAWRLGVTRDFQRRRDGYPTMQKIYSLRLKEAPRVENDVAALFSALSGKLVDVIAAESSCGQFLDPQFTTLDDDRLAFGVNKPCVVVRQDAETRFPGLRKTLGALSGKITTRAMREMNRSVDAEKKPAADVAAAFLRTLGV